MKLSKLFVALLLSVVLIVTFACKNEPAETGHESEGEESGAQLKIDEKYDTVRNGVRLILAYNRSSAAFEGTVENVTDGIIKSVRVEVHLSGSIELGPTERIDLASGEKRNVTLSSEGHSFEWWKAHPEAGEGEHEGEPDHEHGEQESEHSEQEHEHGEEHGEHG